MVLTIQNAFATTVTINSTNFQFTPININVIAGDIVHFKIQILNFQIPN